MKRTLPLYVGLVLGLFLSTMYVLVAEPQQEEITSAVVQEPVKIAPPQGTKQYCIPQDEQMRCSISKRTCIDHDDCTAVLI